MLLIICFIYYITVYGLLRSCFCNIALRKIELACKYTRYNTNQESLSNLCTENINT